jgi:thiol-disulfide isomerase/thioredoxin
MKQIILLTILFLSASFHPKIGSKYLDFSIENQKGKSFELSSIKHKMILLDFWASWCGPCRKENPNVVEVAEKYKSKSFINGKGLEVVSISLDKDREKWLSAINNDNLNWRHHGIDEAGEVAKLYGITSIPYSFLIDSNGNILAQGDELRGLKLHITLDKFLKD